MPLAEKPGGIAFRNSATFSNTPFTMTHTSVAAFVDWKSQIHNAGATSILDATQRARTTLNSVSMAIAHTLRQIDIKSRFVVQVRLYHGWHRGVTPTDNRRALLQLENNPEFLWKTLDGVRFELPIGYGENLLHALPHRATRTPPRINLPDTLRAPIEDGGKNREKMVDTALACDILTHARFSPKDWRLIVAEDDDLVPALFVSEAWTKDKGGRTFLLRKRDASKHISLEGLLRAI